jgi:hypothetical protein
VPVAAIERPLRHEQPGITHDVDASVLDTMLDASFVRSRHNAEAGVPAVSRHAGYGTADTSRVYEVDYDVGKAIADATGGRPNVLLSQCNDFSVSVVEDSSVGRAGDVDVEPVGETVTVPLNVHSEDYFKLMGGEDSMKDDPSTFLKRHRPEPGVPETFSDKLSRVVDSSCAVTATGESVTLKAITDILNPAFRSDGSRACWCPRVTAVCGVSRSQGVIVVSRWQSRVARQTSACLAEVCGAQCQPVQRNREATVAVCRW